MTLADLVRKGILTLTCAAGALFARDALADGFNTPQNWDKPVVAQKESKISQNLDAWLRATANSSPTGYGSAVSASGIGMNEDIRLGLTATGAWQRCEGIKPRADDLDIFSKRFTADVGAYLTSSPEFEFFMRPLLGYEHNNFSDAISMNAQRGVWGADLGIASQELGGKLTLSAIFGAGYHNAEFQSGFRTEGNYQTYFFGMSGTQRLHGQREIKGVREAFFDNQLEQKDLAEEFRYSLHISIDAFLRSDDYQKLQRNDGAGFKFSLPNVLNLRKYSRDENGNVHAVGTYWKFTPYVEWQHNQTNSEITPTGDSTSDKWRMGVKAELMITEWFGLFADGGYEWYKFDDTTGSYSRDGLTFSGGLMLRH